MYGKLQESGWAHWNHSFHMYLSYLQPVSCVFSHPEFLSAHLREWLQPKGCKISGIVLLPGCPQAPEIHLWRVKIADGSDTLGRKGGSDGKESACNAGDPGSIPGLGGSPGEGNSYPGQYSFLENPLDRGAWQATVHGITKSRTQLSE